MLITSVSGPGDPLIPQPPEDLSWLIVSQLNYHSKFTLDLSIRTAYVTLIKCPSVKNDNKMPTGGDNSILVS